jgi:hypothetical protein
MNISEAEAAQALREIEVSQLAMRKAVMATRGPAHLWIWGTAWMAMAIVRKLNHPRFWVAILWISAIGMVASLVCGIRQGVVQSGRFRATIDKRFMAICATLLFFGYGIWPRFFHLFVSYDSAYAYQVVLWMQVYIIGGIWFDNMLLWVGLIVTALILTGFLFIPSLFWLGAFLSGLTLFISGFYIRSCWR